jgi:hypothetical protein
MSETNQLFLLFCLVSISYTFFESYTAPHNTHAYSSAINTRLLTVLHEHLRRTEPTDLEIHEVTTGVSLSMGTSLTTKSIALINSEINSGKYEQPWQVENLNPGGQVPLQVKMATGTRNPSTRRVLPDKEAGMGWIFYPWVRYWAKSYTRRVWRVRVWVYTIHTCLPAGKKHPQKRTSHPCHFSPYNPWIWPKSN